MLPVQDLPGDELSLSHTTRESATSRDKCRSATKMYCFSQRSRPRHDQPSRGRQCESRRIGVRFLWRPLSGLRHAGRPAWPLTHAHPRPDLFVVVWTRLCFGSRPSLRRAGWTWGRLHGGYRVCTGITSATESGTSLGHVLQLHTRRGVRHRSISNLRMAICCIVRGTHYLRPDFRLLAWNYPNHG